MRERIFTWDEIDRVVKLVKNGKEPDGSFSDDQCNLWSMLVRELADDGRYAWREES